MRQYQVSGMSCAACSARVEKAVRSVPGVTDCAVSLLTNSMGVEGSASPDSVIAAVEKAGYGASLKGQAKKSASDGEDALADRETPALLRRLLWSLGFLLVLMYISMGHVMWYWPVPQAFEKNPAALGLLELLLSGAVMIINGKFFVSGTKGLLKGAPNMDTLVALGSAASFGYSTCMLFVLTGVQAKGDAMGAMQILHGFYFESAAMILALITVGKLLEARSKGKTTSALRGLMQLAPKTAHVLRDGRETEIPASEVKMGDLFVVRPGESIPVDGEVVEGSSAVNEAALTGESIPADKLPGDAVSGGTVNQSGFLKCRATRVGEDTTLSQIIRMVSDAAATKAPIAKAADRVSGVFVPVVIGIALVTTAVWLIAGKEIGYALARGISVLVISCPCALGLATPVAIMVGNGVGARNGILFKTAASLEETGRVQTVVLDKTGTITSGTPRVTDILPAGDVSAETLLALAGALEAKSEHPLSRAILEELDARGMHPDDTEDFAALPGKGLRAGMDGRVLYGGNAAYIGTLCAIPQASQDAGAGLSEAGKTPLYFACDDRFLGIIAVADTIKEDSADAVTQLREMGVRVVMLTGDNARTARAVGAQAGVDEVIAEVLPDGKESVIRRLKAGGKTAMVGDGINDAPALTAADVGIAIGAGSDIAIDAADVVLMKSRLSDVPAAIRLSRAALRNIHENLFWAFLYNTIGIPLAAGLFIPIAGWELSPMFGAAAMSLSSFCVVSNALRLNWFKLYDRTKLRHRQQAQRAETGSDAQPPQKTLVIEGMMCGHCENTVRSALEALDGVESAEVSHEKGTAVVTLRQDVPDETLRAAVEAQDYRVKAITVKKE